MITPCTRRTGRAWSRRYGQVPEPFRTTLILRDIEGFSYEEVAAMQGVNLGTVKSRLVRGRACLRALLAALKPGSRTKALAGWNCP